MAKKVALFFGSFNPIHVGHMVIANFIVEQAHVDELWFVVTPHNPLKSRNTLLADHHRLEMVEMAVKDDDRFHVSDVEFRMPKPSYTADTLAYLSEKFPHNVFSLIMGADNLAHFHKWRNSDVIKKNHSLIVYPRPGSDLNTLSDARTEMVKAPLMELSSSLIRSMIKENKDVRHLLPNGIYDFVDKMNFYKK